MNIRDSLFVTLLMVGAGAGCTSSTEPGSDPGVLIPLEVGNTWIANTTELDWSGTNTRERIDTMTIIGDTIIAGERRSLVGRNNGYVNRSDGLYGWDLGPSGSPMMLFRYPAVAGEQVQHVGAFVTGRDTITIKVISTNEVVTVPAGTFNCYHYFISSNFGQFDTHSYIAPNLGFVKMEHVSRDDWDHRGDGTWMLREVILK